MKVFFGIFVMVFVVQSYGFAKTISKKRENGHGQKGIVIRKILSTNTAKLNGDKTSRSKNGKF